MMSVEEFANAESAMVQKVQDLEKRWKVRRGNPSDPVLRPEAEQLLKEMTFLAEEATAIFIDAPISSLNNAQFGWAAYEIANARLALSSLLLFGCNHVTAAREGLVLEALV